MRPSEQRFRSAFADSYADVVRFARRRTDPDRAEDIAADTFLTAWRRIADLPHDPGDARAWLFGIARHCLLNDRRAERRRDGLVVRLLDVEAAPPLPDAEADTAILRADLATAWKHLSATDQEVLALVVFERLTASQVGAVLDVAPGTVRVRLSRARAALRRHLESPTPHREAGARSISGAVTPTAISPTTREVLP
ncbi:MAG TPA: sigma-70 family RNA polymerase sigma factor [Propionibacterium sp.]|jgi:RNA polymerase sigma-70 factor (ECF subfamily)|nr:sigma-70 family RNA polymerase sigma factor [Propionibacterium sp.]